MHYRLGILLLIGFLFISCSTTKSVRNNTQVISQKKAETNKIKKQETKTVDAAVIPPTRSLTTNEKVNVYLQLFGPIAQEEMRIYKIPASITLAQGLLESGFGAGRLAVEGNNHFGIKCHNDWTGGRIYHDDDEKGECFRVYENASESYRDHSLFLSNRNRYAFLFRLGKKDYQAWARGLKKAGYATDPKYPKKLIGLIERYQLDRFDGKDPVVVAAISSKTGRKVNQDEKLYVVEKGDTLYSIARKFKIEVKSLISSNGIKDNLISLGQELIIPKK